MISLRASLWGELCAEGGCALGQGVVKNPDSETGAGYCAAWHRFHARALLYESKDLSADVCVWRGAVPRQQVPGVGLSTVQGPPEENREGRGDQWEGKRQGQQSRSESTHA